MAYQNRFARERKRQRARFITRVSLAALVIAGLGGLGYAAWLAGSELALLRAGDLESANAQLTRERDAARAEAARAEAALTAARQDKAVLQKRYDAEVPSGAMAELYGLLQQRLKKASIRPV